MFWHDRWLQGLASKDIAPNLFNLAHFKKRTVQKELQKTNWVYAVGHISTEVELREFINLWQLLRGVTLNMDEKDEIIWKWTPNEDYSTSSSYKVQFQGSHPPFQIKKLWKARAESKVKNFGWTSMH
jgi:hypothetical protein